MLKQLILGPKIYLCDALTGIGITDFFDDLGEHIDPNNLLKMLHKIKVISVIKVIK